MTKKLFLIVAVLFLATQIKAQDYKFSVQLNTGYSWLSGIKPDKATGDNTKAALGSFSNGFIPLELELRYKPKPKTAINLAYAYNFGLPYKIIDIGTTEGKTNLSTHSIRLGSLFYFTETRCKPYLGIDVELLMSKLLISGSSSAAEATIKSDLFYSVGFIPQFGVEIDLSSRLFLNAAVHYNLIVPVSNIKIEKEEYISMADINLTHSVGVKIGIGVRF